MNKEKIEEIKELISHKNPEDNKKAKLLAMKNNIKLKDLRKDFCQECFFSFDKTNKIRINHKTKVIRCKNCGNLNKWKIVT